MSHWRIALSHNPPGTRTGLCYLLSALGRFLSRPSTWLLVQTAGVILEALASDNVLPGKVQVGQCVPHSRTLRASNLLAAGLDIIVHQRSLCCQSGKTPSGKVMEGIRAFRVMPDQLKAAVSRVGPMVGDVGRELGTSDSDRT